MKAKGKCLCGAIELNVDYASNEVAACHCSMCRNWSGGPMLAIDCADSVEIIDEASVVRFPSSEWADRAFCGKCGTHLFYHLKSNNQYHIPVGLLINDDKYEFTHQIFIDEKPDFYDFKNETKNMTGAEVFAHFEGEA
jgi:hypothetical protein